MFTTKLIFKSLVLASLAAVIAACAGTGANIARLDAEQPKDATFRSELKKESSTLNVSIEASETDLSEMLNRVTPKELYRGTTKTAGVTATVLRDGPIAVNATDNFIYLTVPVSVSMRYGIFETLPLATKLKFKMTARVTPDWKLLAEVYFTGLTDQLLDEVRIGPLSIKPKSIVEGATIPVQRTISDLAARKLNEKFPLKPEVAKVWNAAQKPILLDKGYSAWLKLTPQEVMIYPLYANNRQVRLSVGIKSYAEVSVGPEPIIGQPMPLPLLRQASGSDRSFKVALNTDLHFKDLVNIASPLLLNKELGNDGKSLILTSLDIYGNGDRMVIKVDTKGSIDGTLYLTGRPYFNPQTGIFSVEDVDFDLQTSSLLLKSASWLFQGTIRSTIHEKLNMDLTQRLTQAHELAGKTLARVKLADNLFLSGNVKSFGLNDVLVRRDRLSIQIYSEGETSIVMR